MHWCLVLTVEGEDYNLANTTIIFPGTSVVGDTAHLLITETSVCTMCS